MSDDRTARINLAADAVLDCCLKGPKTPLAMLSNCLERLTRNSPLTDEDRTIIEQAVVRRLVGPED